MGSDELLDERGQVAAALFGRPAPSQQIARYRVRRILGEGAMGVVYEGWDEKLERSVALKLVHRRTSDDADVQLRFRREALALAKFAHPNVVTVHELGEHKGQLFIAMELVHGPDLRTWLREGPHSWQDCLEVFVQAGRALDAAHRSQLVHRDFKPANCILADDGRLRVLDFGLARGIPNQETEPSAQPDLRSTTLDVSVTATGALVGTPAYMAPEQLQGTRVDAMSDQFAFCVAFYEALVGVRPFSGTSAIDLLSNIQRGRIQDEEASTTPAALLSIVVRGLDFEPKNRWPDMGALVSALERFPIRRRRGHIAAAVSGLLAAVVGTGLLWPATTPCADLPAASLWSADRSARVRAALRSERDPQELVWNTVNQTTNAWSDRWSEIQLDACRASRVEHRTTETSHARQLACLERQADTAAALIAGLVDDKDAWEHAPSVAQSLPVLERCANPESLLRVDDPPPSIADEVADIRATLDDSLAAWTRADHEAAVRLADAAWERARSLDDPATRADVGNRRGWLYQQSAAESAEEILVIALADAEVARDDLTAADIAIELVATAVNLRRPKTGSRWRTLAHAKIDRAHADPTRVARLAVLSADLAGLTGDKERADRDSRRSLELFASAVGAQHITYAAALVARAEVLELTAPSEAGRAHDAAIEALRTLVGVQHPLFGNALLSRGLHRFELGEGDARADFDAALAILERNPTHSRVIATARMARAQLDANLGNLDFAAVEAAVEPLSELPANDPDRLNAVAWKAAFLLRLGHPAKALTEYDQIISTLRSQPEVLPDEVAMVESNAAECLLKLRRWDEARSRFERALEELEATVDPTDPRLAYPLTGLAQIHLRTDPARARDVFERALSLASPSDPPLLANIRWGLAKALRELAPQSHRSLELARAAAKAFDGLGDEGADDARAIEIWRRDNDPQLRQ